MGSRKRYYRLQLRGCPRGLSRLPPRATRRNARNTMTTAAIFLTGLLLAAVSTQTHGQLSSVGDWLGCIAFVCIFASLGKLFSKS